MPFYSVLEPRETRGENTDFGRMQFGMVHERANIEGFCKVKPRAGERPECDWVLGR